MFPLLLGAGPARCKDEGRRPFALQRFAFVFVQPKMAVGCLLPGMGDLAFWKLQDTVLCRLCVCVAVYYYYTLRAFGIVYRRKRFRVRLHQSI